jgi:hypothetical protein
VTFKAVGWKFHPDQRRNAQGIRAPELVGQGGRRAEGGAIPGEIRQDAESGRDTGARAQTLQRVDSGGIPDQPGQSTAAGPRRSRQNFIQSGHVFSVRHHHFPDQKSLADGGRGSAGIDPDPRQRDLTGLLPDQGGHPEREVLEPWIIKQVRLVSSEP